ncbi:hypothetical protein Godav_002354 [Gossypium davidsonii]|uniref:F-box domain-containing protein n=1 Tax=Gossypium davidsonii TaxID=34287 RepID=A0A7J8SVV7_GOSDV|nr:hypothetical protein [Gossypium davidsonii]
MSVCEEELDWMSALPDAILHKILSLLPTKHSVQTSILSERWIHLWKFTPVIHILMYSPYKHITPSECTFMHTLGTNTKLRNSISSASSSPLDPCGIMTLMFNTALSLPFQDRSSWFGPSAKECELIALIAFLGYCPSLEMIEIDFRSSYWEEAGGSRPAFALEPPFVELKKGDEQLTTEFLHNVKYIRVHNFFGYKSEIEFIKHL